MKTNVVLIVILNPNSGHRVLYTDFESFHIRESVLQGVDTGIVHVMSSK